MEILPYLALWAWKRWTTKMAFFLLHLLAFPGALQGLLEKVRKTGKALFQEGRRDTP